LDFVAGRTRETLMRTALTALTAHSANAAMELLAGRFGGFGPLGRETTEPGDPGDPFDPTQPYFDEWLGVWTRTTLSENGYATEYFLDEALTQPAGTASGSWSTMNGTTQGTAQVMITEGPSAGYRLLSNYSYDENGAGFYSSEIEHPEYGTSSDTGSFAGDGSGAYRSRWTKGSEYYEYTGSYAADGAWQTQSANSDGFTITMMGNADGSGSGTMIGPEALLPANLVWGADGKGTITWSDGTTTPFDYFGVAGVEGGSGSGSGGGEPG